MIPVSRQPGLRLSLLRSSAWAVVGAVLLAVLAMLLAPAGPAGALPARAAESGSPSPRATQSPSGEPSASPTRPGPVVTLPGRPSPTATPSEKPEPSPTPTRRRTRTETPRAEVTSEAPQTRETPASPLPAVTATLGVVEPTVGIDPVPSASEASVTPVVAREDRSTDPVTRLVQLVVAAAVLLGIGGAVGLYLTRS